MAEKDKLKDHFFVVALFCILTVFLTYPVIFQITTRIAGDGGDGWLNVWNLWWIKNALTENRNIYYTDYQFYPAGESLAFHTLTLYNSFASVPLQMVSSNLILVYNILFLSSFVLAGYGMFLLVNYLVGHKGIAVVSGIAYAFSPYHFAQALGHLNLLAVQWTPFYILFLMKTVNEKGVKNPILAGLFLLLVSLTSWQYMVSSVIFTVLYLVYILVSDKQKILSVTFPRKIALFLLMFGISVFPFVYPMIGEFFSSDYMKSTYSVSFSFIAPVNYILPSPLHPLFEEFIRPFYPVNLSDSVVFLGYAVFVIALYFVVNNFKKARFWLFSAFLFFILSLNPNSAFSGYLIPVHNLFRSFFPFFSVINNMERFALMVLLSVLVMFSFGLKDIILWIEKYGAKYWKFLTPKNTLVLISALIIFEFFPAPYYTTDASVPEIFYEMGHDDGNYTILDIPPLSNSRSLYFQTIHNKKILGGYNSRTPPSSIKQLEELSKSLRYNDTRGILDAAEKDNIRYIISYKHWLGQNNIDLTNLPEMIPAAKIFENEEIIIYEIKSD